MVRQIILVMASLAIVSPAARAADDPSAKELMPDRSELPGGDFRYPWQMGPNSIFKSEEEWHKKNVPTHIGIPRFIKMIPELPEDEWQQMVSNMTQVAESGLIPPSGSNSDPQTVMLNAITGGGGREAVVKALQQSIDGMLDSAIMEYIRVEKPEALDNPPKPGEPQKDPGSIAKLKVSLEIWDATTMSNRVDGFDVTGEELQQLVKTTRNIYERITVMVVSRWCASLEEDLGMAQAYSPIDQAKVDEILTKMSDASATTFEVTAKPLGIGDNAYIIRMYRGALPSSPQVAQGSARFRRGRAVLSISYEILGSFAEKSENDIIDALSRFESKLSAFDLTISDDDEVE